MLEKTITLGLSGSDPALADLLAEFARHQAPTRKSQLKWLEPEKGEGADILIFSVTDEAGVKAACATAANLNASAPQQVRLLVLPEKDGLAAPKDSSGFTAMLHKPLRLAELLDSGTTAWRFKAIKTERQLAPQVFLNPFTRAIEDRAKNTSQNLSAREAAFLLAVLEAGAGGLTRERAVTEVWGYHAGVDSHAVETAVYRLRQKLQALFGKEDTLISQGGLYIWKGPAGAGRKEK